MTVEAISNVAFGIQTEALQNPDDVFLHESRRMFDFATNPPPSFKTFGLLAGVPNKYFYGVIPVPE